MADPISKPSSCKGCRKTSYGLVVLVLSVVAPVIIAVFVYQIDSFDAAPLPIHELNFTQTIPVPKRNSGMIKGSEKIGVGELLQPEDIAYDSKSRVMYTGCSDGWLKKVMMNEWVVENWVNTGGRPLGIALAHNGQVIVADAYKGLLNVTLDGAIELLTDEAEGLKFGLTDDVDIAHDGTIYFTDASHKYRLKEYIFDILEGRPHGRLLSYDPSTKKTKVLVRDLYFANGVAVSPNHNFVVFCETPMRRCRKYYIQGERKGTVDRFIDNLPGTPDNIRYDGEGLFWIAFSTEVAYPWRLALKYPFLRKIMAILENYKARPHMEKSGGSLAVDMEGNPVAHYFDPGLSLISSSVKIGDHLYCGSMKYPYITRLNLTQYPAVAS